MTLSTVLGLIFIPVTFAVVEYPLASLRAGREGHHDGLDLRSRCTSSEPVRQSARRTARKEARHERHFSTFDELCVYSPLQSAFSAGCNVGPKYVRPNVTAPPAFRGADDAAVVSDAKNSLGDEQWAAVYREPELQELIRKALANNYDVRIAAQRILEQQAQVRITRSQQFPPSPSVAPASARRCRPPSALRFASPLVDGSFNLSAAWTPDFWGLYRKQTEAARAQLLAQIWAQRAVQADAGAAGGDGLPADARARRQLEITQANIKVRQDSVDLTKTLESGGRFRSPTCARRSSCSTQRRRRCLNSKQQIQQQENAIALLLGENPGPDRAHGSQCARASAAGSCPPACHRSCLSGGRIFSRRKRR